MGIKGWTIIFVGASFTLYLVIAWISRVRDTRDSTSPAAAYPPPPTAWPPRPTG